MFVKILNLDDIGLGSNVRGTIDRNSQAQIELKESIRVLDLVTPLLVQPPKPTSPTTHDLLDGFCRFYALQDLGRKSAPVIVTERMLSETEIRLIQLTTSIHRSELSGYSKWKAAAELMELNPSWQNLDLAEHLALSPPTISRLLSPTKLTPEWQNALREGTVTLADCAAAAASDKSEMNDLLADKHAGASAAELNRRARKPKATPVASAPKAKPATDGDKLDRVTHPISLETKVIVTGKNLTLAAYVDALKKAYGAAKVALNESLSLSTAQAMWADLAKAKPQSKQDRTTDEANPE